jgi:hypothetical protein
MRLTSANLPAAVGARSDWRTRLTRVAAYAARVRRILGPKDSDDDSAKDGARDGAHPAIGVSTEPAAGQSQPRPRRRDRHGRGIRGSLAPAGVPLSRTRPERFDDLVLDAVDDVERAVKGDIALSARLAAVEYGVEEVPPEPVLLAAESGVEPLPLGRVEPAMPAMPGMPGTAGGPARVIVYRRPIELRAPDPRDREDLVHDVVVDRLAELLGVPADELDPPPVD